MLINGYWSAANVYAGIQPMFIILIESSSRISSTWMAAESRDDGPRLGKICIFPLVKAPRTMGLENDRRSERVPRATEPGIEFDDLKLKSRC